MNHPRKHRPAWLSAISIFSSSAYSVPPMVHFLRLIVAAALILTASDALRAEEAPDFNLHVLPILNKYCSACHSADDAEGKLALDSFESLMRGGEHGAAITPGRSDTSRLIRLVARETKPFMPPDDSEPPKPAEMEVLRRWIDAGAKGPSGTSPDPTMLVTPAIKPTVAPRGSINQLAASPRSDLVAVARYGEVELLAADDRTSVRKLTGHVGNIHSVAFSRDGAQLVAASGEPGLFGEAKLWNAADGTLLKTFRGHGDALLCAQLSPDGKLLATGSYDHTIVLWEVASGKSLATLEGHNGAVYELAFHPAGHLLASASGDRTVKLWRLPDGARLDTLKESTKELYALAFHPRGERLAAGGVDNRIRVWQVHPEGRENGSPLLFSKFAHEQAILRLAYSADGDTLVSCGEDSLVKVWNAADVSNRQTLERQSDWPTALAMSADGKQVLVGRLDGTLGSYATGDGPQGVATALMPLPEVPAEIDYGPQPPIDQLAQSAEAEPNDEPAQANPIGAPGVGAGRIFAADRGAPIDADLWKFTAKKDDQWIIETNAARSNAPLDTKIEVLTVDGQPVPRLLLRAVRNTSIEFRGASSEQRGFRLENWEEMLLNEYVYLNGEVMKHYQQRRGPDADGQFYPENGNRMAFFDTTAVAHALGEPGYMVVPYPLGTELPNNGLPVFTLNYVNDDDGERKLGKDSRLTFVAPADGEYLVRVTDVRRFAGENFNYQLIVRRPQPGFKVTLQGGGATVNAGSGKPISVKAERIDNFRGPIRVEVEGLPPGFSVTTPLEIAAGLYEAQGVINALPTAPQPTPENMAASKVVATAIVAGKQVQVEVNNLGALKLAEKPKLIAHLELLDAPPTDPAATDFPPIPEITIEPGRDARCRLRVERHGFDDLIQLSVDNLPHGVIVEDIGLNGVLIPKGQTERTIFLRAEPWVLEQSRLFYANAQVEGNQTSLPMRIVVKRPTAVAEAAIPAATATAK
jgi:WD40 repeat protein